MRCLRCGNDNPDQNRFCGMCGSTLLTAPETPTTQPQRVGAAATPAPAKETPATRAQVSEPSRRAPVFHNTPSISGPSFLGLNDPGPRKRAGLSLDPKDATSRDLDYLLEDNEEEQHHSGAGKFLLIVVALALAVGLGYLRWKNQGFGWLHSTAKPPAVTQPASDETSSSHAPASQLPAAAQPVQPPPSDSTPASTPANTNPPTPPAPVNVAPSETPAGPSAADTSKPAEGTASAPASPDEPSASAPKDSATAAKPPAATESATDTTDEPKPEPAQPATKPPAETTPAGAVDPVAEAQKYLYGRGVRQDCDRGMRYLKPAANQGNPRAMIEMGALYSAGLCTPHDLPTAYRWFARALRRDPDNQDVQTDLKKLWGEMTQPERQLAIKLTQ
jgi:hypothetical protein